jgi:hypothetical protein
VSQLSSLIKVSAIEFTPFLALGVNLVVGGIELAMAYFVQMMVDGFYGA